MIKESGGYNQHDAYGFHGAGRIFTLTPQMCLRVRVRLFLFFSLENRLKKRSGWHMAKQIKGNGTEWKGKAFRHGLFSLSLSIPHCHSHFTWYFFL